MQEKLKRMWVKVEFPRPLELVNLIKGIGNLTKEFRLHTREDLIAKSNTRVS